MIFSPEWLALREAADRRARSLRLTRRVAEIVSAVLPLRILDLATGTGANLRYLAGRLPPDQQWLLVDHDPALLAHLAERGLAAETPHRRVEIRQADLETLDSHLFDGRSLVTASALLDLVSERWLQALAERCHAARATVLFALTYDGRIEWSPEEPGDLLVLELVNRHQQRDKGFGPAAGPAATDIASRRFAELGYRVEREPSDWMLTEGEQDLQRQLVQGWGSAASATAPERLDDVSDWMKRRVAHVDANRSRMRVGHQDLAAWL
jgi:hypothetical protein